MRRGVRKAFLLALVALVAACGGPSEVSSEERAELEAVIRTYTEKMAAAYQSGDASLILDVATERERRRIAISIAELEDEGRGLRPELQSLAIEAIDRSGNTSVTVSTLEVWNLRVVALGSERSVTEALAQENRLTYSLIREGGQWRVLSRLLRTSTAGS